MEGNLVSRESNGRANYLATDIFYTWGENPFGKDYKGLLFRKLGRGEGRYREI